MAVPDLNFGNDEDETVIGKSSLQSLKQPPKPSLRQSFKDDPLGSVGLLLSNTAAGARGQPLPSNQLLQQRREQKKFEAERIEKGIKLSVEIMDAVRNAPSGQRENITRVMGQQLEQIYPEAAALFTNLSFNEADEFLNLSTHPVNQAALAENFEQGVDMLGDETLQKGLWETSVVQEGDALREQLNSLLEGRTVDWKEFIQINKQAGERGLSDYYRSIIKRDPRVTNGLISGVPVVGAEVPSKDRVFVFRIDEDGNTTSLSHDTEGNFFDLQGNSVTVNVNDRIVPASSLQGGAEDLGLGDSQKRELDNAQAATMGVIATIGDLKGLLTEFPDLNTLTADVASVINGLKAEVMATSRALGVEIDTSIFDISEHSDTFKALGITNQRAQSAIINVAYSLAQVNNPDGRISGPDFKFAVRELGANASDPDTFRTILTDVANRAQRNFRFRFKVTTGKDFEGDLGQIEPEVQTQAFEPQPSDQPEGTVADGPGGQVIVTRNGQWVLQ